MPQNQAGPSNAQPSSEIVGLMALVPTGEFLLTAQHEDRSAGMLVRWVQVVCGSPPMLSVAVEKGKAIMPLISESRRFALCQLGEADRLLQRKFSHDSEPGDDPFLGFEMRPSKLGNVPIVKQSLAYFECELACHMDVEGDHDLFVGRVHAAGANAGPPRVHFTATESAPPTG